MPRIQCNITNNKLLLFKNDCIMSINQCNITMKMSWTLKKNSVQYYKEQVITVQERSQQVTN